MDLNLLPALQALLRRRSVTRAAMDVGLSQPAMSRALERLRALLDDPLLIRVGRGYVLTPRAEAVQPRLDAALDSLSLTLSPPEPFDPKWARRKVVMLGADYHGMLLMPPLARRLAMEAPEVNLSLAPIGPDVADRIMTGTADLAFAVQGAPLPPGAESEPLFTDRLSIAMRRDHPMAGRKWTLDAYAAAGHATVAIFGDGQSEIDARLAASGLQRRVCVTSPHFVTTLATVAASDLITTLPERLTRRFAKAFGLVLASPPFDDAGPPVTLVWSRIRSADPVLIWLRALLREAAAALEEEEV